MDGVTTQDSFEVDGIVYTRSADISIKRYKALQKLDLQFGFDTSFKALWDATTQIKQAIDERKSISDIAYINEGVRRGLQNVDRNEIYQLHTVALWYNAPFEDSAEYSHEAIVAKMQKWEAAGMGVGFFFSKAANSVMGFRDAFLLSAEQPETSDSDPSPNLQ